MLLASITCVDGRVLKGGISTNNGCSCCGCCRQYARLRVGTRWFPWGGWSFGTLLGPEITGPGFSCMPSGVCGGLGFVFSGLSRAWPKPYTFRICGVLVVGVMGLLFGNCIVDASIL